MRIALGVAVRAVSDRRCNFGARPIVFWVYAHLQRLNAMRRGNVVLGNIFLAFFGLIAVWVGGVEIDRLMTWPAVQATIVASDVQAVQGGRHSVGYRPVVSYSYRVDGRQYQATGVTVITLSSSWKWAQSLSHQFRRGATVTAYINPSNPSAGYLVHRFSLLPVWLLLPGLYFWWLFTRSPGRTRVRLVVNELGVTEVSPDTR
jgi:hypothetical protein